MTLRSRSPIEPEMSGSVCGGMVVALRVAMVVVAMVLVLVVVAGTVARTITAEVKLLEAVAVLQALVW